MYEQAGPSARPKKAACADAQDAYQVLRVPRNFTLDQLKSNYKRLALQLHPDKNLVTPEHAAEIFKILTNSYKELLRVHEMRESDKTFAELRTGARRFYEDDVPRASEVSAARQQPFKAGDGGFDAARFNAFFTDHRLGDPAADRGYGDWMRSNDIKAAARQAAKREPPKQCKSLMLHVDAMSLGKSRLGFSLMGVDDVDDYSVPQASIKSVGATDLRVAYSERGGREEDEGAMMRREYRDVEELKRDRANIAYTMNDKDAQAYEDFQEWNDKREASRQGTLRRLDNAAEKHHQRVQNMIMSATR